MGDLEKEGEFHKVMQGAGFTHSKELQEILDKARSEASKGDPYYPYPAPFEHFETEDSSIDDFLMLDNANLKCNGLASYYRELQSHNVFTLLEKIGGVKSFFEMLNLICRGIKENNNKPIYVRNFIIELLQEINNSPGAGIVWQILILIGIEKWMAGIEINEGDTGFAEMQALCDWIVELQTGAIVSYDYTIIKDEYSKVLDDYLLTTQLGHFYFNEIKGDNNERDEVLSLQQTKTEQETIDLNIKGKERLIDQQEISTNIMDISKAPLCKCVEAVQAKYTAIRNKAMIEDQENEPEKIFLEVDYANYSNACTRYAGDYINDLLKVKHTCRQYESIQFNLDKDKAYWKAQSEQLGKEEAEKELKKKVEGHKELRDKALERLKVSTGSLNEIYAPDYWAYYNSLLHWRYKKDLAEHGFEKENKPDPYALHYKSDNSIEFQTKTIYFPFDCYNLSTLLGDCRRAILDIDNYGIELAELPIKIFEETELKYHSELAKWAYDVIALWVQESEDEIYKGKNKRLLDSFLKNCEEQASATKEQKEVPATNESENDYTLSTIEDWLFEFKEKMSETDYQSLVSALMQYFDTGTFPAFTKPIQINDRPNKKLFGWHLNRIFKAKGKGVEKELLLFAKQNIALFANVQFDENNIYRSNLYKYLTTKTQ